MRLSGSGVTKNIAALIATVMNVLTASQRRRLPPSSERAPTTGALTAISTPAMARPQPSHAEWSARTPSSRSFAGPFATPASFSASAASTTSRATKSLDVIHRVNTNVVITALNAAEPQSHRAHAVTTRFRTGAAGDGDVGRSERAVSSSSRASSALMLGS